MATGGKWSFEPEESQAIMAQYQGYNAPMYRLLHVLGLVVGARISELLSITASQVITPEGTPAKYLTFASDVLKGGKSLRMVATPKAKPGDHVAGCKCKLCEPKAVKRRPPEARMVEIPPAVHPFLQAWLAELTKRLGTIDPGAPLFMSRKRSADGSRKAISRQQAHYVLKNAIKHAGLQGNWGTHSYRKTYAMGVYLGTGKDIMATRDALGHRDIATTQKYLRSASADVRQAVYAIAERYIKMVA